MHLCLRKMPFHIRTYSIPMFLFI
uniref:Uncharacterized protein n=1 Tax=Rhizophora mucronata TaxID=61149 RepID=A0A2P2NQE5_RHIMU